MVRLERAKTNANLGRLNGRLSMRGQNKRTGKHTVSLSFVRAFARSTPFATQPSEDRPRPSRTHPPSQSIGPFRLAHRDRPAARKNPFHPSHRAFSRAHRASHRVVTIHPVKTQRVIIRARKTRTACARTVVADLGLAVCASRKPNRKISFVSPRPGFHPLRVSRASRVGRCATIGTSSFATSLRVSAIRAVSVLVNVPCGSASREGRRWIASRQTYSLERVRSVWGARG